MKYQYYQTSSYMGEVDINDESNLAIECANDEFELYYFAISTTMGVATIFKYGPISPDVGIVNHCECSITKMEWDDVKIPKMIGKFLNDNKLKITQVIEVDKSTALDNCIDLVNFMKGECR